MSKRGKKKKKKKTMLKLMEWGSHVNLAVCPKKERLASGDRRRRRREEGEEIHSDIFITLNLVAAIVTCSQSHRYTSGLI